MNGRMRLVGTIAYIVLVGFVIFIGIQSVFNAHDASRQATAALHQNDVLLQRLQEQQHDAATQHDADESERLQLLNTQTELQRQLTNTQADLQRIEISQRQLLRYLREHGIAIPARFVRAPRMVRIIEPSEPAKPQTSPPATGTPLPTPPTPPLTPPTPTLPNGKPAPGNSGDAPGHIKPGR